MASLDPRRVSLGPGGIDGLVWPAPYPSLKAVHDRAITALAAESRRSSVTRGEEVFTIVANFFLQESLAVIQAHMVATAIGTPGPSTNSRLWGAFSAGRAPEPSPYLRYLAGGLAPLRAWKKALRPAAGAIKRTEASYSWPTRRVMRQNVVATTLTDVEQLRASSIDERVVYVPISTWFPRVSDPDISRGRDLFGDHKTVERFVTAITGAAAGLSIELRSIEVEYLRSYLIEIAAVIGAHMARLVTQPQRLPHRLWTGTGGILWSRMLRTAVRKHGGHASGHDHAEGHGHFATDFRPFWEFFECDEFVTLNPTQVAAIERHLNEAILPTSTRPRISHLDIDVRPLRFKEVSPAPVRRILYAATVYPGERVLLPPLLQDLPALDWQARLFSALRKWGYEVVLKPHPESRLKPPLSLTALCDDVDDGPFESAVQRADLVLFDLPQSTTFGTTLRTTSLPVVVVDLGMDEWDPHARALLDRRCAIVSATFDEHGRVQVDWESLRDALETARDRSDPQFAREYLAYGS